ncbi:MAG: alanine racemase [Negativicutes bacterium]|nr:alanine racemase [Negativicutes bacterium]
MIRPTVAEIDLAAIRHNIGQIRATIGPKTKLVAVVKANAYGHGARPVSRTALQAGADCLAVALPEEGAELREAGVTVPIFVLGLTLPEQADFLVQHNLIATTCAPEGLRALDGAARARGRRAQIILKVDTGMGRIGVTPDHLAGLLGHTATMSGIEPVGMFTHLAMADASDKTCAAGQLTLFQTAVDQASSLPYLSAANSATIIDLPAGHFNTVRPGIILYGLPPSNEMHHTLDLRPAMSLKSRIVYIKQVPAGTDISYGCTYTTDRQTYIATLPLGYADGYSRLLSNKAHVLIGGRRRPVVGRVCMDQLMVDLGPVCDAAIGDEAVLFGRQGAAEITVTELADLVGTINYELVCAVSARVPRLYLNAL